MKNKNETDIISIDLDEEQEEKKPKTQEIELKAGEMYVRIPADRSRIREVISFLEIFEQKLPRIELPTLPQIRQPTETIQKLNTPTPPFPVETQVQQPIREDTTILKDHIVFEKCPKCGSKIKKKKIEMASDGFKQVVVCKNRRCDWKHEYLIKM